MKEVEEKIARLEQIIDKNSEETERLNEEFSVAIEQATTLEELLDVINEYEKKLVEMTNNHLENFHKVNQET